MFFPIILHLLSASGSSRRPLASLRLVILNLGCCIPISVIGTPFEYYTHFNWCLRQPEFSWMGNFNEPLWNLLGWIKRWQVLIFHTCFGGVPAVPLSLQWPVFSYKLIHMSPIQLPTCPRCLISALKYDFALVLLWHCPETLPSALSLIPCANAPTHITSG